MQTVVREYDSKIDTKRRVTLRGKVFDYYHVSEYTDGRILLEPRELVAPFQVSENTLAMMDASMESLKNGQASEPIDLSDFEE